ncbi:hypothetical protein EWM64_g6319 [Hericium alpestre]|uniref:5-formyltetrahydrofolate cyclo-ligase n=1 Tax=Hericium alpestre TaxID=135208 RepID=A0A4Y9ZSD1_9AGAM|nr:hypothetical protein EWM64_g6319 [Hericium alpestre]
MSAALVRNQKRALRKYITETLRALPSADVQEQSRRITERILASPFFLKSRSVSCYLSMPTGEPDTAPLVSEILRTGKTLFVPKIDASKAGHMDLLRIYDEEDLQSLPAGTWGIKEPTYQWKDAARTNALDINSPPLEVIFVPGVAFDHSLSRLGYGMGYYDRFISAYFAAASGRGFPRPLLVALALREQIIKEGEIPTEKHDWKVDLIVSPDEVLGNDKSTS